MAAAPNPQSRTDADLMIDIAAGVIDAQSVADERRTDERYPYVTDIGVAAVDENGTLEKPITLTGRNISLGGVCLAGHRVFTPGTFIVLQLVRSNGTTAIVGARVQHCRYVGNSMHETGVLFTPLPAGVNPQDLMSEDGSLRSLQGTYLGVAVRTSNKN